MVATSVVDDVVDGWFLIAPPLSWVPSERLEALGRDQRPKAVAVAEHDQYAPLSQLAPLTEGWINTTTTVITGTDHFMAGATTKVLDQVLAWLRAVAGPGQA
jgi:alpha/beta superfamily hydrolase